MMTLPNTDSSLPLPDDRRPDLIFVEDQDDLRKELAFQLRYHHISVREVSDGAGLERELALQLPDIVLLDLTLPDRSGFDLASELKQRHPDVGIIMLTARTDIDARVMGFEVGADIYLSKPIDFRELHACIKSLLARLSKSNLTTQWFFSNTSRKLRTPSQQEIELTSLEAVTFEYLLKNYGLVFSREALHETLGFIGLELNDIRLNTLMSRLRRRLLDFDPELRIVTWRNKGYTYVGPPVQVHKTKN